MISDYYFQEENAKLNGSVEKMKSQLLAVEGEKRELLTDNQRMAEMLATSEGDSAQVSEVIERLTEERRSLLRQCQQLRDNGTFTLVVV